MTFFALMDPARPDVVAAWWNDETGDVGGAMTLDELSQIKGVAEADRLALVLAGTGAVVRSLNLPMKRQRDAERAARLALQESLAQPIETPVLALGPDTDGVRLAALIDEHALREALSALHAHGLDPDVITLDQALLPAPEEGSASVFRWGPYAVVRTEGVAFTAEEDFARELIDAEGLTPVEVPADGLATNALLNFRVGALRKRKPLPNLRAFRAAASVAVAASLLFLTGTFVEAQRYGSAAKELRAEAERAFSQTFPGTPIIDLERQIQGQARTSASSDFLVLSAVLTDVLEERDSARLRSLTYREDGELTAELSVTAIGDLETIATELSAKGVFVEEGSDVRGQDGAFITRLFLRAS